MRQSTGRPAPGRRSLVLSLCILFALLISASTAFAQPVMDMKISISFPKQTLTASLRQLESATHAATHIVFAFDAKQLKDLSTPASSYESRPLAEILDKLLKGSGFGYQYVNNSIVISSIPPPVKPAAPIPQPGSLRGRIVDFETSQPLPGATVRLETTDSSNHLLKTELTDEKGFYHFPNIPEGSYQLTVSYSGYQSNSQTRIRLGGGRDQVVDIKMQAGNSLSEVLVTSGGRKVKAVTYSTEKDMVAQIKNSTGVISGISNEMITRTGDRNAAEVVKRISGVTVVDDRFIVIRGMNERYNLTFLNQNVAPSTELYSKAFAYDLLPSSIIDRIIVYKSPVANLVADYGGGAIQVFTKNAMPVRHLDIGIQFAHRPGSTMSRVNSYTGGKYDFMGFDDGSRKLPSFSPGYFQTEKRTSGVSQTNMVKGFSPDLDYGTVHSLPDMQLFLNYYNTWKLGRSLRLYDLTSVTFTHETKSYDVYHQTGNTYAYGVDSTLGGVNWGGLNKFTMLHQTSETGKINVLENLTLKLNSHHTFEFKNFLVNEGRKLTSISDNWANQAAHLDSFDVRLKKKDIVLSLQQRMLYSGNLGGTHSWGTAHMLSWNLGYTYDLQHIPDQRGSHFWSIYGLPYTAAGTNPNSDDDGTLGMISRIFTKNEENIYNVSLDYTLHLNDQWQFRAGTYQMYKLRNVGRRVFRVNRAGLGPDEVSNYVGQGWSNGYGVNNPTLLNFPLQQLGTIWNPANFPADGTGLAIYDITDPTDSYVASEQNNAGYIMTDWKPFKEKVTINAGLRMEFDRQKAASALPASAGGGITLGYANHPLTSWLPSVNIGYRPSGTTVLRAGYGRTVNRPEFREISSFADFDYQNNERVSGDPGTVTAVLDNLDFRAEWYPRSAQQNELFNAGVFYKYIQHPIERLRTENTTSTGNSNFTQISFGNALSAKVLGVEAEIRKSLSFIGGRLFRNLTIVANGAWIQSSTVQITGNSMQAIRDTAKGRPLQGQSPYIVNAGLFYENAGWGTKIGLVYNVNGPRIYAKSMRNPNSALQRRTNDSLQYRADLLQLPFHQLDLSFSQRIVRSLQMKITVQNILDQLSRIVEDQNLNQKYDPERKLVDRAFHNTYYNGDNIYNSYKPGRYFLLQLTYAF